MIVALALLAALVFGSAVVIQREAALEAPAELAARPGLLLRLIRRPRWLLGLAGQIVAFGLQAAALHRGSLVVVQPIVTTSLLFTLLLAWVWYHEAISAAEWRGVVLVLAGLSFFLIVAHPSEQSSAVAGARDWLTSAALVIWVVATMVGAGLRSSGRARAAFFGVAAGFGEAFMTVLAKAFAGSFGHGVLHVFATWTPYALVAGGITALLLTATAYQAGHPTIALPIITVADPVVGCLIGIGLFGEQLRLTGVRGPIVAGAVAVLLFGLVSLGRSTRLASMVTEEAPA
jgi:drug/metabolite transporter (DMT)-like permease